MANSPRTESIRAFVALGSNLGDREKYLASALDQLRTTPGVRVSRVSSFWPTAPVGGPPGQGEYLNAAAELETTLAPRDLLDRLLAIERELGRERREPLGPRTIDLDLLLFGAAEIAAPDLVVPHPRMHERGFVLGPLAEIAPTVVHPATGKTIVQLLAGLRYRPLEGRTAVVTGSSKGIGRAIALKMAERGARVVFHARRSLDLAAEAARLAGNGRVLQADLGSPAECLGLVDEAWREPGGIDIWVQNAGADILTGEEARKTYPEKLHRLLDVDVRGTMLVCREVGRRMKAAGRGVILVMGWDQAKTGMAGDSGELFAAAKAAVMGFARSLALSLAPEVRVNALAPGWIKTAWGETASASWQERVLRETPLARWGTPEDVARVACWLASDDAAFVTGQVIRVNGGAVR